MIYLDYSPALRFHFRCTEHEGGELRSSKRLNDLIQKIQYHRTTRRCSELTEWVGGDRRLRLIDREIEAGTFPEPKSPGWSTKGRKNG